MGNCYGEAEKLQGLDQIKEINYLIPAVITLIWIDNNILSEKNHNYYKILREKYKVKSYESLLKAKIIIQQTNKDQRVVLICATSLNDKVYQAVNKNQKVQYVVLFGENQKKAHQLMGNLTKIKYFAQDIDSLMQILNKLTYNPKENIDNESVIQL